MGRFTKFSFLLPLLLLVGPSLQAVLKENKTTDGFLIGNSFLFASPQAEPEPESSIAEAEPSTEAPIDESTIDVSIPSEVEAASSFLFASGHNHDHGHVHDHGQDQSDDHRMSEHSSDIDSKPANDVLESEITIDDGSSHAITTTEATLSESIEISSVVDVKIPSMHADLLETEITIGNGQDNEHTVTTTTTDALADDVAEEEAISISSVVDVKIASMPEDLLEAEIAIDNDQEYTETTTPDALAVQKASENEPVSISSIVDIKIPHMPPEMLFDDKIEAIIREEMEGEVMKMKMNNFNADPLIDTLNDVENLSESYPLTTIANVDNDEIIRTDSGDEKTTTEPVDLYDQVTVTKDSDLELVIARDDTIQEPAENTPVETATTWLIHFEPDTEEAKNSFKFSFDDYDSDKAAAAHENQDDMSLFMDIINEEDENGKILFPEESLVVLEDISSLDAADNALLDVLDEIQEDETTDPLILEVVTKNPQDIITENPQDIVPENPGDFNDDDYTLTPQVAVTNDETITESVTDDNVVTEANPTEIIKELNTENANEVDTLSNEVELDSEAIVDVIKNFISEQDPILELFLSVCFVHPDCLQLESPLPDTELGEEGRQILKLLKARRSESARVALLKKIQGVQIVIKRYMFQVISDEVGRRGVSIAATKNIIDAVKDVWEDVQSDIHSVIVSVQEIFSRQIPDSPGIISGIAQIADILQRIPTHVLEQYKDAAKHGFSRYRQHFAWDSWKNVE